MEEIQKHIMFPRSISIVCYINYTFVRSNIVLCLCFDHIGFKDVAHGT